MIEVQYSRSENLSPATVTSADCVIIGGGPAGAACGIALKRRDPDNKRRVVLVEREPFPRFKVCGCCFNGAGAAVLRSLACDDVLHSTGAVQLNKWQAQFSGRTVKASLPTGWAVSRNRFDQHLLARAGKAGVEVIQPATAKIISSHAHHVELEIAISGGAVQRLQADHVVVASGLAGAALEKWLPWKRAPSGPIGAGAAFATSNHDYQPGTIYMACGEGGYAGIVVLENGYLDIAAALYDPSGVSRSLPLGQRVSKILSEARMPVPPELSKQNASGPEVQWKGTPLLHRQRIVGANRILAIGDAAGYVEPFTGEGMAWALRTAKIAADCIADAGWDSAANSVGSHPGAPSDSYRRQYHRNLSTRRLPCRIVANTLRNSLGRKVLFASLGHFPWLAKPFIRTINAE